MKIVQNFDGPDLGHFGPWHSRRTSATYAPAHLHRPAIKTGWGRPRTLGCRGSIPSHLFLVSHSSGEPCLPFSSIQFIRSFGKSNRVDRVWCPNLSISLCAAAVVGGGRILSVLGWLPEMSDSEEHHFESKADAGASKTYPQQAGTIRKNGYIVIKNRPCKVIHLWILLLG